MTRSTGDGTLDRMLGGGAPEAATVLVRGGPGTGKGRVAATFLRAGLAAGEECLHLTADEPLAYLDATLPDDDALTLVSASRDGDAVRLEHGGGEVEAGAASLASAFDEHYDRVVVDGAGGLADLAGGGREVAALLTRFERDGATCLITTGRGSLLTRHAAATVECWGEAVEGDYHTFVRVHKRRGAVPDTRRYRLAFTAEGAEVVARERPVRAERLATGIGGFDDMTGGGFVRDGVTVFEHDGSADHWPFTGALCGSVIDSGATVVLITAPGILGERIEQYLESHEASAAELMERDDLYLVDTVSQRSGTTANARFPEENVVVEEETGSLQESIRALKDRLVGQPVLAVMELTPVLHLMDDDAARQLFYWTSSNVLAMEGSSLVMALNRGVAGDELTAFFTGAADATFRTWQGEGGLQYVSVGKSPDGSPGRSRVVEPIEDAPFVRLR